MAPPTFPVASAVHGRAPAPRDLEELLDAALEIAGRAGEIVLEHYEDPGSVQWKADRSPLTAADRAAHESILHDLTTLSDAIPVISEESTSEPGIPTGAERFWLVDPLDGTREFLKRTGEFTVNVALVEHSVPVLGVVRAPVQRLSYYAAASRGAYRRSDGQDPSRIYTRRPDPGGLAVVVSRDHVGPSVAKLLERLEGVQTVCMGSALKFCVVAEGGADLYPRDLPTMEWDTAAGQCVVEEAGGRVIDMTGAPLRYGKPSLRNPAILTVGDPSDSRFRLLAGEGVD